MFIGKLKSIWDELSLYDNILECTCGQLKIQTKKYQRDCIVQFLMGMSDSYGHIRGQIAMMGHIPPVNKIFDIVEQQEKQRQIVANM